MLYLETGDETIHYPNDYLYIKKLRNKWQQVGSNRKDILTNVANSHIEDLKKSIINEYNSKRHEIIDSNRKIIEKEIDLWLDCKIRTKYTSHAGLK